MPLIFVKLGCCSNFFAVLDLVPDSFRLGARMMLVVMEDHSNG